MENEFGELTGSKIPAAIFINDAWKIIATALVEPDTAVAEIVVNGQVVMAAIITEYFNGEHEVALPLPDDIKWVRN